MWPLPDITALRLHATYTDLFMLTLTWNVGLFGMFVFGIFVLLVASKLYHIAKQARDHQKDSLLTQEQQSNESAQVLSQQQPVYPNSKPFKIINFLASLTFYLLFILAAAIYLPFYAFGVMGSTTGHDVLSIFALFSIVAVPTAVWKLKTKHKHFKQIKKQVIFTAVMLALWLGLCIFSVVSLKGVCVCVFNDNYGVRVQGQFFFSTQWTRSMGIKPICPDGQICHLYATLPEQTSTQVFLNTHSGLNVTELKFVLKDKSGNILQKISSEPTVLSSIEFISQRNVHSVLFTNLQPNTLYQLTIIDILTSKILRVSNYKTLPDKNAEQLRLAVGGDVGMTLNGSKLTSYLSQYDPDVLIIGGDIAYDDAMRTCSYSWDNFYWIFEELDLALNRTVPKILSIGNHDLGYDALTKVQQHMDLDNIPLFFLYNPQHSSNKTEKGEGVPVYSERQSNHYHLIGSTVHINLDSGYMKSYEEQTNYIKDLAQQYDKYHKFANYHNPIYPSCTDHDPDSNDRQVINNGTKYWTALFEQFKFVGAMQHHTHHRKFTKKLVQNKVAVDGVRYIGDGSWGVKQGGCGHARITKTPQLFQNYDHNNPSHIWQITLRKTESKQMINYTAVDMENSPVFQFIQELPSL